MPCIFIIFTEMSCYLFLFMPLGPSNWVLVFCLLLYFPTIAIISLLLCWRLNPSTGIDWRVGVGAAFLLFFFLVIPLVCFWKVRSSNARKMYEDIYMPSPPPSPTLLPSLSSPHFRLPLPPSPPSPPPPPPPAYSVIGGEVGYDYMEVGLLRFQQEMENGDENSLYISYDNRNAAND